MRCGLRGSFKRKTYAQGPPESKGEEGRSRKRETRRRLTACLTLGGQPPSPAPLTTEGEAETRGAPYEGAGSPIQGDRKQRGGRQGSGTELVFNGDSLGSGRQTFWDGWWPREFLMLRKSACGNGGEGTS